MRRWNAVAAGLGILLVLAGWYAMRDTRTMPPRERGQHEALAPPPPPPRQMDRNPVEGRQSAEARPTVGALETKPMKESSDLLTKEQIEAVAREIALDVGREPSPVECDDYIKCEVRFPLDGEDLDFLEGVITDSVKIRHPKSWMIPRDLQNGEVTIYLMRRPMRLDEVSYYFDLANVDSKVATGELEELGPND